MRSLYWKIFISFWAASILIIVTTAWIIGEITRKSSIPAQEQVFMDSYANAAVATYEAGRQEALLKWMSQTGKAKQMTLFLLVSNGRIISHAKAPPHIEQIAKDLADENLTQGLLRFGKLLVSHEILSMSGRAYRLAAISEKPLTHHTQVPWAGIVLRTLVAIFISGLICYLLSVYLTQPLRSLRFAAKSIAKGQLHTRVGRFRGHHHDEIDALSDEFDRMAERLEQLMLAKERLLQDISHELRSPLARLHVAVELGRNKTDGLAEEEFLRIEKEASRLNHLISEILEYARLDKSTDAYQPATVNLIALLEQLADDANYESHGKRIKLLVERSKPLLVHLDKRLLQRAMENIIRNALRYTPKNGTITITLKTDEQHIHLVIEDDGPGVPEHQLEKIFSPFYRVDPSRGKSTGGYGLGLSIAMKAIALHHGTISASNKPAGGLQISITLPFLKPIIT